MNLIDANPIDISSKTNTAIGCSKKMEGLCALFAQSVFVKQVLGHAVLGGTHPAEVGHPVTQLLYGLHLLVQVVCLNEVTHLSEKDQMRERTNR